MKERLKQILDNIHKYNINNMSEMIFNLDSKTDYDLLVIAPGFTPSWLGLDKNFKVTMLSDRRYVSSYLLEKENIKIAYVNVSSGCNNLMDNLVLFGELSFKKLLFVGSCGALKASIGLGEVFTPSYSVDGSLANLYLEDSFDNFTPFKKIYPTNKNYIDEVVKKANSLNLNLKVGSVFCTDSISLEYSHLDEIRAYDTDLIEMETASFYKVADLLEVPSIALLIVSDNSTAKIALVGKDETQERKYQEGNKNLLPEIINKVIIGE